MENFKFEVRYSYFILFLQINTHQRHFQNLLFFFFPVALGYATFATNTIKQIVYSQSRFTVETNCLPHWGEGKPGHLSKITNA